MNILLEIADRDLVIIGLAFLALIMFGIVIFSFFNKNHEEDENEETLEQKQAKEELERVFNQMSKDLENKNSAEDIVETFEKEQEDNAIISYKELLRQANIKEEPIAALEKEPAEEPIEDDKKFKNSDIISPIFGVQKEAKYEGRHSDESNRDFLNSLKEFRKNL